MAASRISSSSVAGALQCRVSSSLLAFLLILAAVESREKPSEVKGFGARHVSEAESCRHNAFVASSCILQKYRKACLSANTGGMASFIGSRSLMTLQESSSSSGCMLLICVQEGEDFIYVERTTKILQRIRVLVFVFFFFLHFWMFFTMFG